MNLPTGATFSPQTGEFSWTPTLSQSGSYVITFSAVDAAALPGQLDVVITVGDDPTPVEQAENLVTTVIEYDLPTNVENSYLANLKKIAFRIQKHPISMLKYTNLSHHDALISRTNHT